MEKKCRLSHSQTTKKLTWSKLKAFADNKINVTQMIISVFDRVKNIEGKGENAGYHHFLLFPQCFVKASFADMSKLRRSHCVEMG